MTPEQLEIERVKFETWIGFSYTDSDLDRVKRLPSGRYMSPSTYRQWESWLAALRHNNVVVSREWVGLTDQDLSGLGFDERKRVIKAAAKLKEKNHG